MCAQHLLEVNARGQVFLNCANERIGGRCCENRFESSGFFQSAESKNY